MNFRCINLNWRKIELHSFLLSQCRFLRNLFLRIKVFFTILRNLLLRMNEFSSYFLELIFVEKGKIAKINSAKISIATTVKQLQYQNLEISNLRSNQNSNLLIKRKLYTLLALITPVLNGVILGLLAKYKGRRKKDRYFLQGKN